MAVKKRVVSICPKDAIGYPKTIVELLDSGVKPPKATASEVHSLDIHCVEGISSVKDALSAWSAEHGVGYQELTRYACFVAASTMEQSSEIDTLERAWVKYRGISKEMKQAVRRANGKPLDGLSKCYYPIVSDSYHLWCWSDDNKQTIFGILRRINMGIRIVNPFVARALSDLPELGELSTDLLDEYNQGQQHLRLMVANLTFYITEFTHKNGIW